jgi:hypothetical protein
MKFQLIIISIFCYFNASIQNLADTIPVSKNAISIELLGTSCNILSIQYDRIIKKNKSSFYSVNVGAGYMPDIAKYKSNQLFGSSIALDWNSSLYKRNHIVGGIGLAYSDGLFQYGLPNDIKKSHKILFGSLRIGYKFQKTEKGVFYKIMCTPIFKIYEFSNLFVQSPSIFPLIGIGAGYSF